MGADDAAVVEEAQRDDGRSAAELIEAYRRGPGLLRDALAGMTAEQLRARPIEGMMSSLEVLGHVADSEQYLADRMKRCVAMDRPLLVGVDGWLYLDALRYQDRDPELDLELVDVTRRQAAANLDLLPDDAWIRDAIHTETGLVTLRQLLLHTVRHLEEHVERIREKRVALGV